MTKRDNLYKTMRDIYTMTPRTLDECEMAAEFLKAEGTPEASGAMEMVVMIRKSIEWVLKNGNQAEVDEIKNFDRTKYEAERRKMFRPS